MSLSKQINNYFVNLFGNVKSISYFCYEIKTIKQMNFRIIKCKDKQEVLLFRDYDCDIDSTTVELRSFIGDGGFFHSETVVFQEEESAQRFIKDFSLEAAQEFIDRFVI